MENASTVNPRSPFDRTGQKPSTRSRLGNGKILPLNDGRSATARRFKDLVGDISADLGGASLLSEGQRQLIRRAAMLSADASGRKPWRRVARLSSTVSFTAPCAIGSGGCSGGSALSENSVTSPRLWATICKPRLSCHDEGSFNKC